MGGAPFSMSKASCHSVDTGITKSKAAAELFQSKFDIHLNAKEISEERAKSIMTDLKRVC